MKKQVISVLIFTMMISTLLTGCGKGSAYKKAVSMFESGNYQEARDEFAKLEDYKDSAAYVTECDYIMAGALLEVGEYAAAIDIFKTIPSYKDATEKCLAAENGMMHQTYSNVFSALNGQSWFYNGGSDTLLNRISFTGDDAEIGQVYYDGNGKHEYESVRCSYLVDDQNVIVTLSDGTTMEMPYTIAEDVLTWKNNVYFTMDQIEEGIQGYWNLRSTSLILGKSTTSEHTIFFDHGSVISESASKAYNGSNGQYYYYGPYEGSYTLNFGGLDTQMKHGRNWFFNIIDGKVTVLYYDSVCSPYDHLHGEKGYQF